MGLDGEFISRKLYEGQGQNYSHMLVVRNINNDEYSVEYVRCEDDVREIISSLLKSNFEIEEVYNYSLDLETQLGEFRSRNIEPVLRIK